MKSKKKKKTDGADSAADTVANAIGDEIDRQTSVNDQANESSLAQDTLSNTESAAEDIEAPQTQETLNAKIDKLADSLLRAKADYKNLERRGVLERSDAIRFANAGLMRSLLEVVDDFERSLAATEPTDENAAMMDGVKLIHDNLLKALSTHGLERIDALHQPFDPSIHEAMMQQPSDEYPPGTVIDELARGYRLRDRVIRPARVIVSSAVKTQDPSQSGNPVETPAGSDQAG